MTPHDAGLMAYWDNNVLDNPFDPTSKEWNDWRDGYEASREKNSEEVERWDFMS